MSEQVITHSDIKFQEYFLNMGPQHPATHGVLRLILTLDGEEVVNIEPDLGYIHRGIEKMCEYDTYRQIVHLTDRFDYLSSHMNNEAFCLAVEKALEVEVNDRIKVIRTMMDELTRIASHLLWWGVMGMDIGALTTFMYAFRDREMINEIMEKTTGARLTMSYNIPGGVMFDLHKDFQKDVKNLITHMRKVLPEYDRLLTGNIIFQKRMKGVGYLSPEDAVNYGATGPVARGSGISSDTRKKAPYSAYDRVEFNEVLEQGGDNLARYNVRMQEMYESLNILEQLVDNIPEGDFQMPMRNLIKLPKGEFYQSVETARGEFGVFIVSDGKKNPYRVHFRSPGLNNLNALIKAGVGGKIADLVATMSTFDFVVPDIDR
jgi:NADH-quinone oxidoreductase subunit D/NADH-quinone oxidoreductase subunit C/D